MISIRAIAKNIGRFVTKRLAGLRPACFRAGADEVDDTPQYVCLYLYTPSPVKQQLPGREDVIEGAQMNEVANELEAQNDDVAATEDSRVLGTTEDEELIASHAAGLTRRQQKFGKRRLLFIDNDTAVSPRKSVPDDITGTIDFDTMTAGEEKSPYGTTISAVHHKPT